MGLQATVATSSLNFIASGEQNSSVVLGAKQQQKKYSSLKAQWVPVHWMEGFAYFLCMVHTEPDEWALLYKRLEAPVC